MALNNRLYSWKGSTNQISLFLRMIEHEMKPCVLIVQHQMRPELAHLTVPAIYPELQNHLSVERYPNLPEIKPNVFFLTHSELGKGEHVGRGKPQSSINLYEADMAIALARHLILMQGLQSSQITIYYIYLFRTAVAIPIDLSL